jgi:hypothetical protein
VERLNRLYAAWVRSRRELGVLRSLNQKLFNEYLGLRNFLAEFSEKGGGSPSRRLPG